MCAFVSPSLRESFQTTFETLYLILQAHFHSTYHVFAYVWSHTVSKQPTHDTTQTFPIQLFSSFLFPLTYIVFSFMNAQSLFLRLLLEYQHLTSYRRQLLCATTYARFFLRLLVRTVFDRSHHYTFLSWIHMGYLLIYIYDIGPHRGKAQGLAVFLPFFVPGLLLALWIDT